MPVTEKNTESLNRSMVALELFKARSVSGGGSPRQLAISCFRDAMVFLEAAYEIQSGRADLSADESPLDPAFAPNLKRTHPINLMSRVWGDLRKVQEALADLDANPGADYYEPYSWSKPEVNQARALFPTVVNRLKQMTSGK
ncbi:hypothetical protein [Schlesneria sp. T3-172]|uniref:hypothetical protein n=1 Tax=Schlesneria TaxID=656899 RepID=UPI002F039F64